MPVTGELHIYQIGVLSIPSMSGNTCVYILYNDDANYIHVVPIPSQTKPKILRAYKISYNILKSRYLEPKLQRLENEASGML